MSHVYGKRFSSRRLLTARCHGYITQFNYLLKPDIKKQENRQKRQLQPVDQKCFTHWSHSQTAAYSRCSSLIFLHQAPQKIEPDNVTGTHSPPMTISSALLYKFFSLRKKKRFTTKHTQSNIVLKAIHYKLYSRHLLTLLQSHNSIKHT